MRSLLFYIIFMLCAASGWCAAPAVPASARQRPFTVVIDPGHGGRDIGCRGRLTNEKTIVLNVARKLGDILAKEHPEVKVVFTRDDDRFIELNRRAQIANRADADLFISIHVNSIDAKTRGRENVHGASVYTLGLHRNEDNLNVAMRENAVIELEPDFSETYQGFDPNSSESYIIFELTQNRHQQNSIEFADAVRERLVSDARRADKGVRQAGFLVLRATSMAAVLVELDFICNPAAERFMASEDGRAKMARSIADAFTAYYKKHGPCDQKATQSAPETSPDKKSGKESYAVQFLTSPKPLDDDDASLKGVKSPGMYRADGQYKYYTGPFDSLRDAKKSLRRLKKTFPQAFIIKMRDGQRVAQ